MSKKNKKKKNKFQLFYKGKDDKWGRTAYRKDGVWYWYNGEAPVTLDQAIDYAVPIDLPTQMAAIQTDDEDDVPPLSVELIDIVTVMQHEQQQIQVG